MKKNRIFTEKILEVAKEYGTPCHVLMLDRLRHNYSILKAALSKSIVDFRIFYSLKTNYLPIILQEMKHMGSGIDAVSGYELRAAFDYGFNGSEIVFNGPMKTKDELEFAIQNDVYVNVDSLTDLKYIEAIAQSSFKKIDIGLRVNPSINIYTSEYPTYNIDSSAKLSKSKFGWPIDDPAIIKILNYIYNSQYLNLTGIHCHLGSQIVDTDALLQAYDRVFSFVADIRCRFPIKCINIGGGFGVSGIHRPRLGPLAQLLGQYSLNYLLLDGRNKFNISQLIDKLNKIILDYELQGITLLCEPGRFLVSDAMMLVTKVISIKELQNCTWILLDGGLNLMPTAGVNESHVFELVRDSAAPHKSFMLGGPLCYEGDVFSYTVDFPSDIQTEDHVIIHDSGAYTISRSTNFIRPRAPVVAIDDEGSISLCWRREEYEDIFSFVPKIYQVKNKEVF